MPSATHIPSVMGRLVMAVVVAGTMACGDEAGIGGTSNCGTSQSVTLKQTVTAAEALYTLATPVEPITDDVDCGATYSLAFRWADPGRASTDNTMPPLWNLSQVFRFNGGISYFVYTTTPSLGTGAPYVWSLNYYDHASGRGLTSTDFSLVTTFLSSDSRDSVHIEGSISYYSK